MNIQTVIDNMALHPPFAAPSELGRTWLKIVGKPLEPFLDVAEVYSGLDGEVIHFEWAFFHKRLNFEINVETRDLFYAMFDFNKTINDDAETYKELDLNVPENWTWMANEIERFQQEHITCIPDKITAFFALKSEYCLPYRERDIEWLKQDITKRLAGIKAHTYITRGMDMSGVNATLEWFCGNYEASLKIELAEHCGTLNWINWCNPRNDHFSQEYDLNNLDSWREVVRIINDQATKPVIYDLDIKNDDDVMDVEEFRACVRQNVLTGNDGIASAVRNNKIARGVLFPSRLESMPTSATHIRWSNK